MWFLQDIHKLPNVSFQRFFCVVCVGGGVKGFLVPENLSIFCQHHLLKPLLEMPSVLWAFLLPLSDWCGCLVRNEMTSRVRKTSDSAVLPYSRAAGPVPITAANHGSRSLHIDLHQYSFGHSWSFVFCIVLEIILSHSVNNSENTLIKIKKKLVTKLLL